MIFFRVEIELASALEDQPSPSKYPWERASPHLYYNERLSDLYEEEGLVLLQLAAADAARETCLTAYAAYTQKAIQRGRLDVERDMARACAAARLPEVRGAAFEEISVTAYNAARNKYSFSSRLRNLAEDWGLNYDLYSTNFEIAERIVDAGSIPDRAAAELGMKRLLPDAALAREVERIYSPEHPRDLCYGIPVCYKLSVRSEPVADEMVDFIAACLYQNRRILSRKITKISQIGRRLSDSLGKLIRSSRGSMVQLMLSGDAATESEYASQFHRTSDLLAECVKENAGSVLFFFVENSAHPGFAKQLLGKIDEDLDILEINEGAGDSQQARAYFLDLLAQSNMGPFYEGEAVFEKSRFYSATEVRTQFNQWRKARLKDRVYRAYRQNPVLRIEKELSRKGSAFEELQSMVGLAEVKEIIRDIIAACKVQKLRSAYYDSNETSTRHMAFAGNPGTAKTTVARLMTEIMKENGILKTGTFIEVGRADLVGKYVGWTASIVKDRFSQAQGGVLFIDEAYALADDSHTFGDEAINTIVQEMENRRGDVIVVFAGYPEKMKDFLAKNEGLRSRVAFHVHFPDYSPEELMGILEKILRDKQYTITPEAKSKAMEIFRQVCTQEEYGNGRFVRNLFEQAVNRQAARISEMAEEEIGRDMLFALQAPDFDTNIVRQYIKKGGRKIGFTA